MEITISTKYLIKSLKIFMNYLMRVILRGENHSWKLKQVFLEIHLYLWVLTGFRNDSFLNIRTFWGPIYNPPIKNKFQNFKISKIILKTAIAPHPSDYGDDDGDNVEHEDDYDEDDD